MAIDLTSQSCLRLHATMRMVAIFAAGTFAVACGSSAPRPPKAVAMKSESTHPRVTRPVTQPQTPGRPTGRAELPRNCTAERGACYPPQEFVRALCKKKYPGVAIAMFERGAPWKHAYIRVKDVAPINSLGGPNGFSRLEFLEEVLLLREREVKRHQMIMDVPTSYDVLRLDGTCATLVEDEFMTRKPYVPPRYAPVIWQLIDPPLRQTLTQVPKVDQAAQTQNLACHGSFLAGGGEPCKDATQQLARAIVSALSEGVVLPVPTNLPEWSEAEGAASPVGSGCRGNHAC